MKRLIRSENKPRGTTPTILVVLSLFLWNCNNIIITSSFLDFIFDSLSTIPSFSFSLSTYLPLILLASYFVISRTKFPFGFLCFDDRYLKVEIFMSVFVWEPQFFFCACKNLGFRSYLDFSTSSMETGSEGESNRNINGQSDGSKKPKRQMKTPFQLGTLEKTYACMFSSFSPCFNCFIRFPIQILIISVLISFQIRQISCQFLHGYSPHFIEMHFRVVITSNSKHHLFFFCKLCYQSLFHIMVIDFNLLQWRCIHQRPQGQNCPKLQG